MEPKPIDYMWWNFTYISSSFYFIITLCFRIQFSNRIWSNFVSVSTCVYLAAIFISFFNALPFHGQCTQEFDLFFLYFLSFPCSFIMVWDWGSGTWDDYRPMFSHEMLLLLNRGWVHHLKDNIFIVHLER